MFSITHCVHVSLTFALAGDLVPQDVDLVDGPKVLEHDLQQGSHVALRYHIKIWQPCTSLEPGFPYYTQTLSQIWQPCTDLELGLVHGPGDLPDEHLDGVRVGVLGDDL